MRIPLRSPSFLLVVSLWLALVAGSLWRQHGELFAWDVFGYHLYLPAAFIENDFLLKDLQWVEQAREKWSASPDLYQLSHYPDGSRVIRYTMGQAVVWSPWFVLGHGMAMLGGQPADGYSMPYQRAIHAGILIYLLLGILALRSVLLRRSGDRTTACALFLLVMGTNLLDQTLNGVSMPHVLLFSLYGGILYFTVEWSNDRRLVNAVKLAILMGLAILVRLTEVVCLLLPLFWRGEDERGSFLRRAWRLRGQWSIMAVVMFLVLLPQPLYWYAATGKPLIDPYNNPGEGLDLLAPHTWSFLFSFRKGWFLYTPLMLFAVLGIAYLRNVWEEAFVPVLSFFLLNLYLVSSWTNWWYAESFGSRAMVGSYAVMILPLAGLLHRARGWRTLPRAGFHVLLTALIVFNLLQHAQYMRGVIHGSRMTARAYWAGFGKLQPVQGMNDLLLVDRSGPADTPPKGMAGYMPKAMSKDLLRTEPSGMDTLIPGPVGGGMTKAHLLGGPWEFSPALRIPFGAMTTADHIWVELTWNIMPLGRSVRGAAVTQMEHKGGCYGYFAKPIAVDSLRPGVWNTVTTYYRPPEVRNDNDLFLAFYWAQDTLPILVTAPRLRVFESERSR